MRVRRWTGLVLGLLATGCTAGDDDQEPVVCKTPGNAAAAVAVYAEGVAASYAAVLTGAVALQQKVNALVANPSATALAEARTAWLSARTIYGETEVFRFYDGPIEQDGLEGQVNAWPMDEGYVDGVEGNATSGIINNTAITISAQGLLALNEQGGEENIATGWHAIEFLLWGQDQSDTGPGARPYTDFVDGPAGTAPNADRRRQYLTVVMDQLVADLTVARTAWAAETPGNYRAGFVADTEGSLRNILKGMGSLSGAELAGERMSVAYQEKDQEDEHSCFSDNTHQDIISNARGIQNVWLGRYPGIPQGLGIRDVVAQADAALAAKMTNQVEVSVNAAQGIPAPFDQAILGADTAPGRVAIRATIEALRTQTDTTVEVATALCTPLTLDP